MSRSKYSDGDVHKHVPYLDGFLFLHVPMGKSVITTLMSTILPDNPEGEGITSKAQAIHLFGEAVDRGRVSNGGGWPDAMGAPILLWKLSRGNNPLDIVALDLSVLYAGIVQMLAPTLTMNERRAMWHAMYTSATGKIHITYANAYVANCIRDGWYQEDLHLSQVGVT